MKNNLKSIRKSEQLTQLQLSKLVKISERAYRRIEAGESATNVYTAINIAKALNTTVEKLFYN